MLEISQILPAPTNVHPPPLSTHQNGTFIITNEPPLIGNNHPKPRVHIKVLSGCYKQQRSITEGSRGWQVQDQGADRFVVWWESDFSFTDSCLLAVTLYGKGISLDFFHKGANPIHEHSALMI